MGLVQWVMEWSAAASIVIASVSFLISIAVAAGAAWGVRKAATENNQTQSAKRQTEEEQHVLQLVRLSNSMADAKEFDLQLAAISLLGHHPKYLSTMEAMKERFQYRRQLAQADGTDPHDTLGQLLEATKASIDAATLRREQPR
ncbi:MAG: hypothetical protein IR164_14120 [Devosia sp.]|uniref:hypothetical protein n=1 Tax=Devosia sp. TaxID=1871048 RepID=UPI0019DDDC11|nr:hypothetical protein [Devosia sp.]MBF0680066.1 hypothetical protein [Devosia sp.]